jgi:hypothetical protein
VKNRKFSKSKGVPKFKTLTPPACKTTVISYRERFVFIFAFLKNFQKSKGPKGGFDPVSIGSAHHNICEAGGIHERGADITHW